MTPRPVSVPHVVLLRVQDQQCPLSLTDPSVVRHGCNQLRIYAELGWCFRSGLTL